MISGGTQIDPPDEASENLLLWGSENLQWGADNDLQWLT